MLRTISISSCISVQGMVVGHNADGTVSVQVGNRIFSGHLVSDQSRRSTEGQPRV